MLSSSGILPTRASGRATLRSRRALGKGGWRRAVAQRVHHHHHHHHLVASQRTCTPPPRRPSTPAHQRALRLPHDRHALLVQPAQFRPFCRTPSSPRSHLQPRDRHQRTSSSRATQPPRSSRRSARARTSRLELHHHHHHQRDHRLRHQHRPQRHFRLLPRHLCHLRGRARQTTFCLATQPPRSSRRRTRARASRRELHHHHHHHQDHLLRHLQRPQGLADPIADRS